jgi:hypothetical protein
MLIVALHVFLHYFAILYAIPKFYKLCSFRKAFNARMGPLQQTKYYKLQLHTHSFTGSHAVDI